jgi:hypothetical protein
LLLKAGVEGGFDCLQEGNKEAEYLKHEIKHGGKGGKRAKVVGAMYLNCWF